MKQYIDKSVLVAEINRIVDVLEKNSGYTGIFGDFQILICKKILSSLDTIETKDVDLTDRKTKWFPSKKQMESLKDMLKYNIGVFDYQKFMEVNSLYDDLTKILDYETIN